MSYKYQGFISQSIAPKGAKQIGVYDPSGKRLFGIPLGRLTRPQEKKRYSFGLLSDLHLVGGAMQNVNPAAHLRQALTFFLEKGCVFCAHAGDVTNTGFWDEKDPTKFIPEPFAEYKTIHTEYEDNGLPMYGITGNHDNYVKVIELNRKELKDSMGHDLYHDVACGDDLFLFVGQPANANPTMDDEGYAWLKAKMEANPDKRCHVFTHFFAANDSGSTNNCYTCYFGSYEEAFKTLMRNHGKAIHYHGHSHIKFQYQEMDKSTVYTEKNGFPSVHIPSVCSSRDVVWNADRNKYDRNPDYASSQGYVVDVYDDCLVFNGFEFNSGKPEPMGTFCVTTKGRVTT